MKLKQRTGVVSLLLLISAIAAWTLGQSGMAIKTVFRRPTGSPQLMSVTKLSPAGGEMCEWVPASTQSLLVAALQEERAAAKASADDSESRPAVDADRAPVRIIRDTYPTYSAVAIDLAHKEIVLQDENLFNIMVYERMSNTPPKATMTEPKRVIGGHETKVEFNCGLYIDPNNGDIYSVNNDTMDTMVVFSRNAKGNVPPDRELRTPHRTYGIAVDESAQELFLTVEHPPQIVVYRKTASGNEKPLRNIEGENTHLQDAHGIALDTKNNVMFVSNHGSASNPRVPGGGHYEPPSITVYPLKGEGDVAPIRIIQGSKTQLNWPAQLYFDEKRGELYVANDVGNSILVFRSTDNGDVAPARAIKGPKTGLLNPTGVFLDPANNELVAANMGNHSATVYPSMANGDVAPLRTIRSAPAGMRALAIGNPGGVGYDTKRDEVLVPN